MTPILHESMLCATLAFEKVFFCQKFSNSFGSKAKYTQLTPTLHPTYTPSSPSSLKWHRALIPGRSHTDLAILGSAHRKPHCLKTTVAETLDSCEISGRSRRNGHGVSRPMKKVPRAAHSCEICLRSHRNQPSLPLWPSPRVYLGYTSGIPQVYLRYTSGRPQVDLR